MENTKPTTASIKPLTDLIIESAMAPIKPTRTITIKPVIPIKPRKALIIEPATAPIKPKRTVTIVAYDRSHH
jgi:hypothetical protein